MNSQHTKRHFLRYLSFSDASIPHPALIMLNVGALCCIALGMWGSTRQWQFYDTHFLPGTYIDGSSVANQTPESVTKKLDEKASTLNSLTLTVVHHDARISSTSSELGITRDVSKTVENMWHENQAVPVVSRFLAVLGLAPVGQHQLTRTTWDEGAYQHFLHLVEQAIATPQTPPSIALGKSGVANSLTIQAGQAGISLNSDQLRQELDSLINQPQIATSSAVIEAPVLTVGQTLSPETETFLRENATLLVGKQLKLTGSDVSVKITDQELVLLLGQLHGISSEKVDSIWKNWQQNINRPAQNAEFSYDATSLEVKSFTPPQDGLELDTATLQTTLTDHFPQLQTAAKGTILEAPLPVRSTPPDKTLASTNFLGIVEQIGFGDSEYFHSIPSRIHNVGLTANRINNHLVKPGAEFSFNKTLGDVSAETGYQPAYVIKGGQTVLGDGGGVCQVSTTLFRALLDAGLQITKRRPHSYRVSYYELNKQAGFDATVYSGDVDLRFINDTDHYILIHTENDPKNLYLKVQLFGTSDGRSTEITNYKAWDFRAAPPAEYYPDATLPPGKTVQFDWATSGIKTTFTNVIKDKNGAIQREDTYTSNYIPWSAKFRQGI